jgi:hypothetical protein
MNNTKIATKKFDDSVYVDLENARKAITDASVELVRGHEQQARMILIDWLAGDRGEETFASILQSAEDARRGK